MLILQNISYKHPSKDLLFSNINLIVSNQEKIALIGNNGVGKSTLLKIIAGKLQPSKGNLNVESHPYYVPQVFGQFNHFTIAEAMKIDKKINALKEILSGNGTENNYNLLADDWTIENRVNNILQYWQLTDLDLSQKLETLSGGQKTKVFLAGIFIHKPKLILFDEPSNHLDTSSRQLLYSFIQSTKSTLLVVSHDRKLLNLLDTVCEFNKRKIKVYGGNYDFYKAQKQIENNALNQDIQSKEKALRKAKVKKRDTIERQQKQNSRGKKQQIKEGTPKALRDKMKNDAENSTSKLQGVHEEKIHGISKDLQELRSSLANIDKIKFGFDNSALHNGKTLFKASNINFVYKAQRNLWEENLSYEIISGERITLKGQNGSGKTTLIKLILGDVEPTTGLIYRGFNKSVYIDQDYSLLVDKFSVYQQAQQFNFSELQEHEIKIQLNRFLFTEEYWGKSCGVLSGGEKMRLSLCCLTIYGQSPDIIILDEPTNNLDIQNVEILTKAINEYQGTLIVVSHDQMFLEQINIERTINL